MTPNRTLLIGIGATVVVGLLAVAALRGVAPQPAEERASPAGTAASAAAEAEPAPAAPATGSTEPPPPWANALPAEQPATPPADTAAARREQRMAELQQSMSAVLDDALERSVASGEHLRKALDALEAMDDPQVKAQINLEALRHNLDISVQMQGVARQMQAEIRQPRSAARDARIEELRREFARLQGQVRNDVSRTGAALPFGGLDPRGAPMAPAAATGR